MALLVCKHCGREFWASSSKAMYCFNEECFRARTKKWRIEHGYASATPRKKKRKKRRKYIHKVCEKCGKEFITTSTRVMRCKKCREYRLPYSCPDITKRRKEIKLARLASIPDTRLTISGDGSPTEGDNQWQKQEQTE